MIKAFQYHPTGVCSNRIIFTFDENDIIKDLKVVGGCPGNLIGISELVKGKHIDQVIPKLKGILFAIKINLK